MPEAVGAAAERPPVRWRVREATAADRDGILACRAVTFAGEEPEKGEPDYWRWEFVDNHAGPARLFVAEDDTRQGVQRVVGHYAVIPQRFVLDGATLRGSIVVDLMTHPDYRFQGMFTKIGRFALDACTADPGFEFTTGYPIRKEVIPGHLKVGWRIRFRIGTYVMPLRTGKVLAAGVPALAKVPGLATVVGSVPGWVLRGWSRAALRQRGGLRVERSERVDTNRLDAFWQRFRAAPPPGCLVQERTAEYLAWRFDRNPGRDYLFHLACDGRGDVVAFAVSRAAALQGAAARVVVDACCLPNAGPEPIRALIADVRDLALRAGDPMLAMMVTQPNPLFPDPRRLGFLPTPHRFSFITKPLETETPAERDDLRWHLMWGDTDDL